MGSPKTSPSTCSEEEEDLNPGPPGYMYKSNALPLAHARLLIQFQQADISHNHYIPRDNINDQIPGKFFLKSQNVLPSC